MDSPFYSVCLYVSDLPNASLVHPVSYKINIFFKRIYRTVATNHERTGSPNAGDDPMMGTSGAQAEAGHQAGDGAGMTKKCDVCIRMYKSLQGPTVSVTKD